MTLLRWITQDISIKKDYEVYNQLTSIFTEEGSTDIYYDKNGNMRDVLYAGGGKEHYDYDEYGQLSKVTNDKDKSYTYSYDAQGDRIRYQKNYSEAYDNDTWYESLEQTSFEEVEELLDDKNSDQIIESVRYQSNYRKTHHKCVLMEEENWDGDGDDWENKNIAYILDKSLENAWGDIRYKYKAIEYTDYGYSDDIKSGFGYNGEEQDETGLIYLRARYYNPVIGQFIQLDENRGDAGNIESQNRYAYALNNPNKYIDKNGRAARLMNDGGSFSSIGGLIGAAGKLAKDIATNQSKRTKSTSQMTSQDRYICGWDMIHGTTMVENQKVCMRHRQITIRHIKSHRRHIKHHKHKTKEIQKQRQRVQQESHMYQSQFVIL